jgi:RNA polymerase sigma factor (sigma-70 family)
MSDVPGVPRPIDTSKRSTQSWSARLLVRARGGDRSALNLLFERHLKPLQRWAHGRLPKWARTMADTADLVQEALLNTLRHLDRFEPQGHGALRSYLRRAVENRIADEHRIIARRGPSIPLDDVHVDDGPSPLEESIAKETEDRYRAALARLSEADRQLIVARVELGYNFEQLALISGKRRPDSARVALHRALVKLADEMARPPNHD